MAALVIASHDNRELREATRRVVTAAAAHWGPVDVLVAGTNCAAVAGAAAGVAGVARVLLADGEALAGGLAEPLAALIAAHAANYSVVVAAADSSGRETLPRAAALCGAVSVDNVVQVISATTFVRASHAGTVLETVAVTAPVTFVTLQTGGFVPAAASGGLATVSVVSAPPPWPRTRVTARGAGAAGGERLDSARRVIGIGRGVDGASMTVATRIAAAIGAVLGASRPAVDAGLLPGELLLGQSGKTVTPDLYLALGVSGAVQHVTGFRDSRVIAAVNSDPSAPIFAAADVCWVADLADALPALERALMDPDLQ